MRKLLFLLLLVISFCGYSQDDEYQKYLESLRKEQSDFMQNSTDNSQVLYDEFAEFVSKTNAEFAEFLAKEWALFEEFKTQSLTMTLPKLSEVPEAPKSDIIEIQSDELKYKNDVSPHRFAAVARACTD